MCDLWLCQYLHACATSNCSEFSRYYDPAANPETHGKRAMKFAKSLLVIYGFVICFGAMAADSQRAWPIITFTCDKENNELKIKNEVKEGKPGNTLVICGIKVKGINRKVRIYEVRRSLFQVMWRFAGIVRSVIEVRLHRACILNCLVRDARW